MSRRIAIAAAGLFVLVALGLVITFIQKARLEAHLVGSRNNLRELALFAAHNADPKPGQGGRLLPHVPAGTVVIPGLPPDERLSWLVPVLPGLDQKRQDISALLGQLDDKQPWASEQNRAAARVRLVVVMCPENPPKFAPGSPAPTSYVGIAGVGPDAASLQLAPGSPPPPTAGAFRYDAFTPFDQIADGLSQTLLMGETADAPGPWLRGGFSTVRGLDPGAGVKPLVGAGGQFGGYFPNGANFAMCDGAVRTFTPQTSPEVLLKLATIAGGKDEVKVLD